MHRCLFSWLSVFLLISVAVAQSSSNSQSGMNLGGQSFSDLYAAQRTLLSNFCRLDFAGTRLQAGNWERFRPYTSLHDNPEFTSIVIVTRFDIETPEQPSEELSVDYQAVGTYQLGEGYTADSSREQAEFRVQEQDGVLLITAVSPESPHVSPRAALAWMKLQLDDPKTGDLERAHLLDAVNQLNKLLTAPHPAPGG